MSKSRVNGNQYMITLQFLIEKKNYATLVITTRVINFITQSTQSGQYTFRTKPLKLFHLHV